MRGKEEGKRVVGASTYICRASQMGGGRSGVTSCICKSATKPNKPISHLRQSFFIVK